jgi:hypothetical protein
MNNVSTPTRGSQPRTALLARSNLGLGVLVKVRNIDEDDRAWVESEKLGGTLQVPCLVEDGNPLL